MSTEAAARTSCPVCALGIDECVAESPNFVRCPSCELVYRKFIARPAVITGWDERHYSDRRVLAYYAARRSGFEKMVSLVSGFAPDRGPWLDVGCGPGGLLEAAAAQDWEPHGIDPSRVAIDAAQRRVPGARLVHGIAEEELPKLSQMRIVSLVDVLRCIEQPVHLLRQLHDRLADGGWVVIREANANWRRRQRAKEPHRTTIGCSSYVQEWTPKALQRTLMLAGFTNIRSLPSPTFVETRGSEHGSHRGVKAQLERMAKQGLGPASLAVYHASGRRLHLTPNYVALAQKLPAETVDVVS